MDLINDLIMQAVASPWLYLTLFAVTVIDGFFPPVPSETILVAAAAVLTGTDIGALLLLGTLAAVAAAIGDNLAFLIGRTLGTTRFGWMRRPLIAAAVERARRTLERSGAALILGARYVPVGRVAVNMTAGAVGFPWRRFAPLSVLSGLCWSAFGITVGVLAGTWAQQQPLLAALLGVGLALLIGVIVDRVVALRRTRTARPAEIAEHEHAASTQTDSVSRLAG